MARYPSPRRWKLWQHALTPLSVSTSRMKQLVGALYFVSSSDRTFNRASSADGAALGPIDLSKAKKLKHAVFQSRWLGIGWITRILETIKYNRRDLQQISIYIPIGLECVAVRETELAIENARMRWLDLDNLLVGFWESHSIRVKIACTLRERPGVERTMRDWAEYLLPRLAERGLVGPPEYFYLQP